MRAPRGPRGPILSGEWRELEITGNVHRAAATASRLYWSLLELPTPPLTNPPEGADRPSPVTRHDERRKLRGARSLRTALGQLFAKLGNPENVWVCGEKKARTGTHLVSVRLSGNPTDRVSKMYERGFL